MQIDDSIKISNYKCFGEEPKGFEKILPINIIIGKNNSGKSTLIDIIEYLIDIEKIHKVEPRQGKRSSLIVGTKLNETHIRTISDSTSGGGIPGSSFKAYAATNVGKAFEYFLVDKLNRRILRPESLFIPAAQQLISNVEGSIKPPLNGKNFYRIAAERDIVPEKANNNGIVISPNGQGATNVIRQITNLRQFNRDVIEVKLLNEINKITEPDISFSKIAVEEDTEEMWEIYLRDENNNHVGLSKMGSGIKTILLVILHLICIPKVLNRPFSEFVFAFEELENNLHPSILRRLFSYIIKYSEINGVYFFITTHSSIVIDLFGDEKRAQLVHIEKIQGNTNIATVKNIDSGRHILKDMDFRPSDLLLSNGILWVEGPSDAIILELFLNLFREFKGIKNRDHCNYTIQSLATAIWKYAGFEDVDWEKLASDKLQNKVILLEKINHNHLLIIDNDNNYENKPPSQWKSFAKGTGQNKAKLIHESMRYANYDEGDLENNFGDTKDGRLFFWVNDGTLETYLEHFVGNKGNKFSKYFDLTKTKGYFEKKRSGEDSSKSKVELASEIAQYCYANDLSLEDIAPQNSTLFDKIERLYNTIFYWNERL